MNPAEWVPYFHLIMELKLASEISFFFLKKRKMKIGQRMYTVYIFCIYNIIAGQERYRIFMSLQPFVEPWPLFSFSTFTQSIGLFGQGISLSQGRYLYIQDSTNTE
jgi:hypothetical protein